jgi:SAM-dependent methyltransferase
MARYSDQLAAPLADLAGVHAGQRALDVGCGPGALSAELVRRLGPARVSAVDPSASFVAAARDRLPGLDVRQGAAERLPFVNDSFDAALAQLVVQFMTDPVAGLREMARVTRPGGMVVACVWDRGGGRSPTSLFRRAASDLDPARNAGTGSAPGASEGELQALFEQARLVDVTPSEIVVRAPRIPFEEWWAPLMLGVGPGGDYLLALDDEGRDRLRDRCEELWNAQPPTVTVAAWVATGRTA